MCALMNIFVRADIGKYAEYGEVAFSAARTTDLDTAGSPVIVEFDMVHMNHGDAFDPLASVFRAPLPGIYVFTFNTRSASHKMANMTLSRNGEHVISAYAKKGATMAANQVILQLQAFDTVYLELSPYSYVSNIYLATGQSEAYTMFSGHLVQGFNLSAEVYQILTTDKPPAEESQQADITVAFTATRTQKLVAGNTPTPLSFEDVITNVGNGFNLVSSQLIAPVRGVYLVMFTMFADADLTITMYKNEEPQMTIYGFNASTSSRIILDLEAGDSVWFMQEAFKSLSNCSFSGMLISMSPQKYDKDHRINPSKPVSFTAMRTSPFESGASAVKFPFESVISNTGGGFDELSSHFYAPVNGVYAFFFSGLSSINVQKHLVFYHNTTAIIGSHANAGMESGINHVILKMRGGDSVSFEMQPNCRNANCTCMVFSGYLVYDL